MTEHRPVVPSTVSLPEITVKAVVLSVVLAVLLAAANAYLGLFAGMTVSASIPAAVTSMAVLRLFRRSNVLENNIVQTAASAGEALAAGVIFTIPALVLVGAWSSFDYWQTTIIATVGGLLGVLFTIPLRRALIVTAKLRFPEGVATAEVLKAGSANSGEEGQTAGRDVQVLLWSALAGGAAKFCESGLRLWAESLEGAIQIGRTMFYGGINLSPALLAVGLILGLRTALVVFLGGCLGWVLLVPAYGLLVGLPPDRQGIEAAMVIWSGHVRYVGIGAMVVGGLWTLATLRVPVWHSLQVLWAGYREAGRRRQRGESLCQTTVENCEKKTAVIARTEQDAPFWWLVVPFALLLIPAAWIEVTVVNNVAIGLFMTVVMTIAAFLFSSVAAYMAGLVGSSSNPVSGVTIATIMVASLLLVLFMGSGHPAGPAAALMIGAVVCCAAAMGGDNMQDLKTGHLVGATPWKQQVMQVIGVLAGAVVLAPVLTVLQAKYGIGVPTSDHPRPLSAPQATLMASLANSVFGGVVPWSLVGLGMVIGTLVIVLDQRQERHGRSFRFPILAVALGIYLPLKLSTAIVAGGLVAALAERARRGDEAGEERARRGLLFSAGLITGESLMGIFLALPVALGTLWPGLGSFDPFALFDHPPFGGWLGLLMMALVAGALYHTASGRLGRR